MAKLGPEFRGKLSPGAAEQNQSSLESYRKAIKQGAKLKVEILGSPDCPVSWAQNGKLYSIDGVPPLPLPGCDRSPCCGCCYAPVVQE
jgi:hypothetical protein